MALRSAKYHPFPFSRLSSRARTEKVRDTWLSMRLQTGSFVALLR